MKWRAIAVPSVLLAAAPLCGGAEVRDWDLRKVAVSAEASSYEKLHRAANAFDGDPGTRWSSAWSNDQWISIDLGQSRSLNEAQLWWEAAYPLEYDIQASDDARTWTTVKRVTEGQGGLETLSLGGVEARHVCLRALRRATDWGFSLREFVLRGPLEGMEPEFGGLVRPHEIVTIFDHDYEGLSRMFAEQCAADPPDSSGLSDDAFLDLIEKRAFDFFWYEVHPENLFVVDSTTWKARTSNAGIGFQLGACIAGHHREYKPRDEIYARVEKLLDHCWDDPADPTDLCLEHHEGWTYHWVDIETGRWQGEEHVCTHDSITYLCGVIAAKHYFAGTRAGDIASNILAGVNWAWIIHGGRNDKFVSNCYAPTYDPPCGGDVRFYDGMKFDYLFPIGGGASAIDPSYWHNYGLDFPWADYNGHFWRIERPAPWCHQWDHVWFDFRFMKDDYADYHQNSVEATLANRQWCLDHGMYDENLWGVGPSRGPAHDGGAYYHSYGAPPDDLPFQKGLDNDGTITPCAALPSIVFTPQESIRVARYIYDNFKDKFWKRYGFPDALNPSRDWYDREYISIDQGPIVINIENHRSGLIHNLFAREPLVWSGLRRAGFMGIVDNFDPSEHSPPYGQWQEVGADDCFQFGVSSDHVREGTRALKVAYNVPPEAKERFLAVRPSRRDFSPYRYLSYWIHGDPGLRPVLITAGGSALPLASAGSRPSGAGWRRLFFTLPDEVRSNAVANLCFGLRTPGAGAFWLDGIFLTDKIPAGEPPFVIDDLEAIRSAWKADKPYTLTIEPRPDGSGQAMRVDWSKSGTNDALACVIIEPGITNWSRAHSLAVWARGDAAILIRLGDGAGRVHDVATQSVRSEDGWQHLFFNVQANLDPNNCWEPRYDKRDIRKILLLLEPGKTDCGGSIRIASITLTD